MTDVEDADWLGDEPDLGASLTMHGITLDDVQGFDDAGMLLQHCGELQRRLCLPEGRKLVRIRCDILDDLVAGELSWREFAVLCAVYANIAKENSAPRLVREQLIAMASGFTGHHVAKSAGVPTGRFLTTSQIRTTLDDLHERRFFARVSLGRRSYFSNTMKQGELEELIACMEARKLKSKPVPTPSDTAASVRLRAAQIAECTAEPIAPTIAEPIATTGEALSGEALSGEALFRKNDLPENQSRRPFSSTKTTECFSATFQATIPAQADVPSVTNLNDDHAELLASKTPSLRKELEALQRRLNERRAE